MTDNGQNAIGYGYEDDSQGQGGGLIFGLNAGNCFMTKFEFNPNGGKEGAAQEALDIMFNVDGRDISFRQFPVTKAFDGDNGEVDDARHPAMVQARKDFNAMMTHILSTFVSKDNIKQAFTQPISSFEQFCNVAANLLPRNYASIKLDVFAQWQWNITGDNEKTYLRLPNKMKHGKWLCQHVPPAGGEWKEDKLNGGLHYVDEQGNKHPFARTKWFMESNFAHQQSEETIDDALSGGGDSAGTTSWQ